MPRPHVRAMMIMVKKRRIQKSRRREVKLLLKRFSELRVVTLANIIGAPYLRRIGRKDLGVHHMKIKIGNNRGYIKVGTSTRDKRMVA